MASFDIVEGNMMSDDTSTSTVDKSLIGRRRNWIWVQFQVYVTLQVACPDLMWATQVRFGL